MSGFLSLPDGKKVPVRDGLVIGRVAGCDIVIDDGKASRRHAKVCVEGGVVEIEDMGSSNGTMLNGKPVQRRLLRDGDEVQIGTTVMVFHTGGAASAPAAAAVDDVDLFGGDDEPAAAPPPAAVVPPPRPAAAPPPPPPVPSASPSPPPPPSPPPSPPRRDVVEFADEVIEVKKPARAAPAAAATPAAVSGVGGIQQKQRVLQFHKVEARGGAMGDDLAQMGNGSRLLVYGAVLLGAVALAWAIISFVS